MQALIALERYRVNPTTDAEVQLGLALREARDECDHGEWDTVLQALGIDWDNRREWARRLIDRALAAVGQAQIDMPEQVAEYYAELCRIAKLPRAERAEAIREFIRANQQRRDEWPDGWKRPATSRQSVYNHLEAVGAPQKLRRRKRADAGQPRAMTAALADMWRILRTAPSTKPTEWPGEYTIEWDGNGTIRVIDTASGELIDPLRLQGRYHRMQRTTALRMFRMHCPAAAQVADSAFKRVDQAIPAPLLMTHSERQYRYHRQERGWQPPHIGYWAYDMTIADIRVWDRNPNEPPYRPFVVGIVDQLSHLPMALLATKDAPSKYTVKSALRQAIFPKGEGWEVYGFPWGLYGDHGEVQKSKWMRGLAEAAKKELGRDLRIESTPSAYRSWSNGSAETLFKDLHHDCDAGYVRDRWPVAYMGHRTDRKPAHLLRKEKPVWVRMDDQANWYSLPTLEEYQQMLRAWVVDYIIRTPKGELAKRIGFSRLDFWRVQANQRPELVAVPDESVVLSWLLERVDGGCYVNDRGEIHLNGARYQHAALIDYARMRVGVRFDFYDIATIRCYDPRERFLICEAPRNDFGGHISQRELRARAAENRQIVKQQEQALKIAAQTLYLVGSTPDATATDAREPVPPAQPGIIQLPVRTPHLEPPTPQFEERVGPDGTPLRVPISSTGGAT